VAPITSSGHGWNKLEIYDKQNSNTKGGVLCPFGEEDEFLPLKTT